MISDIEYLFTQLLATGISSLEKCLCFRCFIHLDYLVFAIELYELYILDINSLSDVWFAKLFPHFWGCLFILFKIYFAVQKLFSLILFHVFTFAFGVKSKTSLGMTHIKEIFPMFASRSSENIFIDKLIPFIFIDELGMSVFS